MVVSSGICYYRKGLHNPSQCVLLSHMKTHTERESAQGGTVKTSISIDSDLLEDSRAIARLRGFRHSYSAYVANLLRKDMECLTGSSKPQ